MNNGYALNANDWLNIFYGADDDGSGTVAAGSQEDLADDMVTDVSVVHTALVTESGGQLLEKVDVFFLMPQALAMIPA